MSKLPQGHLDTCDKYGISGWVWHPHTPGLRVNIECHIDGELVSQQLANGFRSDLLAVGIGDGRYGFKSALPLKFFDNSPHVVEVSATYQDKTIPLIGSPRSIQLTRCDLVLGDFTLGEDGLLQGWVIDRKNPSSVATVAVTSSAVNLLNVRADQYRSDLVELGERDGRHGFQFVLPESWYRQDILTITVTEAGTGTLLGIGPTQFNIGKSYLKWIRADEDRQHDAIKKISNAASTWSGSPILISVILPVYNPPVKYLEAAICSVLEQSYSNWQLCIADDASTNAEVKALLLSYAERNSRIKIKWRKKNGHISKASNSALSLAEGMFIALLDHDDLLHPHALLKVASIIHENPEIGMIFTDEDKCDENGTRYGPYFKYGWDPELLLGQNCVSHLGVFRTDLVRDVGGFRSGYDGSQDYDLALRISCKLTDDQIHHIPEVLYHWRAIPGSTALANAEKNYAVIAMRKALRSHLRRKSLRAMVKPALHGIFNKVEWKLSHPLPSLCLIIFSDQSDPDLSVFLALIKKMKWPGLTIIVSPPPHPVSHKTTQSTPDIQLISHKNKNRQNMLLRQLTLTKHDVYVGLEYGTRPVGDIEVWLAEMTSHALREDVGLVSAKLVDASLNVVNAGWQYDDPATIASYMPLYKGLTADDPGHGGLAALCRSVQGISSKAFSVRSNVLHSLLIEGECPPDIPWMITLCERAANRGLRNLVTPFATAITNSDYMS